MKRIPFTKMQGIGNDYLYVDCTKTDHFEGRGAEEFAKRFSDRHFGIGSDGVIVIRPSEKADFRMEMLNADGSQGRMCGNGIRCLTRYVIERGLTPKKEVEVETLSGIRVISTGVDEFGKFYASVNMGKPSFRTKDIPVNRASGVMINEAINAAGSLYNVTAVSMGNPHAVIFTKDVDRLDISGIGPEFEKHRLFPEGVNARLGKRLRRNDGLRDRSVRDRRGGGYDRAVRPKSRSCAERRLPEYLLGSGYRRDHDGRTGGIRI